MRKLAILAMLSVVIVSGCVQEQPTGRFLESQNFDPTCGSEWNCTPWSSCVREDEISGVQDRSCVDINSCENDINRPQESRLCGLPRVTVNEPSVMVLSVSDLDDDWRVEESFVKNRDNVTRIERILGFQKGYYVHYISEDDTVSNVYNYVSIYPLVDSAINMTFSFEAAKDNYKIGSFYEETDRIIGSISELDDPVIGDYSIAYNITTIDASGLRENFYIICFTKWDVAEIITLGGAEVDYDNLIELARKAEEKIN